MELEKRGGIRKGEPAWEEAPSKKTLSVRKEGTSTKRCFGRQSAVWKRDRGAKTTTAVRGCDGGISRQGFIRAMGSFSSETVKSDPNDTSVNI